MSKTITFHDATCKLSESCYIENISIHYNSINAYINSKTTYDDHIVDLANEYKKKLAEIKNTRDSVRHTKYAKDKLLCKIIELCQPPFYLKKDMFNYKALVLYFMRHFKKNTILKFNNFVSNIVDDIDLETFKKKIFNEHDKIIIANDMSALFHLINIQNSVVSSEKIHEKMIYDTLNFGDFSDDERGFKNKVSSIGWVKGTLSNPDFIYADDTIIAEKLKFNLAFIRETGKGTKSQPYMYHIVGLKLIKEFQDHNRYAIVSQFPIEIDREYSNDTIKISRLHHYIQCDRPIYVKKEMKLPLFSKKIITNDSCGINRLKKKFES